MFLVNSIFYIKAKLRQINKNSYQTKIELVCIAIDKNNLLDYECVDDVIRENNDNNFCCFYYVTYFSYYSYQVDHFQFDKSVTSLDVVEHTIQKQNELDIVTLEIVWNCFWFEMIDHSFEFSTFERVDVDVKNSICAEVNQEENLTECFL